MEDGAKEDPVQSKDSKFLGKAGWVKKATGRLLASYKDRYIRVEKTELVVYENEDLQNCLERLDLENYDICHELKSPFMKKHRLILIRSPKSGNKVHDVKFQAQTAEEKETWIKALSDGISRAKNKVFDEVKIDESNNLEHVTRTRPKANRNRRPPTRIHMKEVAIMSSDGILRLDLDLEDALMPNGNHHASVDGTEIPKEVIQVPMPQSDISEATEKQSEPSAEEKAQTELEVSPQKKIINPPMPPTKEVGKPSATPDDEPDKDDGLVKKVLKPPMPPSKEAKPSVSSVEENTEKAKTEKMSEKSPDTGKKTGPPPTPPNKPSSSSSMSNLTEESQSRPNSHPPTPPSKEKKPFHQAVKPDQEFQGETNKNKTEEDNEKEEEETAAGTDEAEQLLSKEALPSVRDDEPESLGIERQDSDNTSGETTSSGLNKSPMNEPQAPTDQSRKSPSPLLTPKQKPEKPVQPDMQNIEDKTTIIHLTEGQDATALLQTASDTSASSPQAEEALHKSEDSLSLSPLLCHLHGEKKKKAEEKSIDSGQHSDNDSEASGNEDSMPVSPAALSGSQAGLDVLETSEDDNQVSENLNSAQIATMSQVRSKVLPCQRSEHISPCKPPIQARSASFGDLLSDSSVCIQVRRDDVMKLEAEVALEMENTSKLLCRVTQSQRVGDGESMPEDLLATAMEKLKKADHVLREVNKLKPATNSSNRKSW